MAKSIQILDSDEEIAAARERAKEDIGLPRVVEAHYLKQRDMFLLTFSTGVETIIPRHLLQGLSRLEAGDEHLFQIEILGEGSALNWPGPDIAFSAVGLLSGIYGSEKWMHAVQQRAGRVKSERKTASSRENGRKGGRPRKKAA